MRKNMLFFLGAAAGACLTLLVTAPQGAQWENAVARWSTLKSDADARFDREVQIDATKIRPSITYGTHPGMVTTLDAPVPAATNAQERQLEEYWEETSASATLTWPASVSSRSTP